MTDDAQNLQTTKMLNNNDALKPSSRLGGDGIQSSADKTVKNGSRKSSGVRPLQFQYQGRSFESGLSPKNAIASFQKGTHREGIIHIAAVAGNTSQVLQHGRRANNLQRYVQ